MTRHDTRHDATRHDTTRHTTRHGTMRHGMIRHVMTRHYTTRHNAQHDLRVLHTPRLGLGVTRPCVTRSIFSKWQSKLTQWTHTRTNVHRCPSLMANPLRTARPFRVLARRPPPAPLGRSRAHRRKRKRPPPPGGGRGSDHPCSHRAFRRRRRRRRPCGRRFPQGS